MLWSVQMATRRICCPASVEEEEEEDRSSGRASEDDSRFAAAIAQSCTRLQLLPKSYRGIVSESGSSDQMHSGLTSPREPVTNVCPSGAQAAVVTGSMCFFITRTHEPFCISTG